MTDKELNVGWNFDNSYTRLPQIFYTRIKPTSVKKPRLVILNRELARFLGLNIDALEKNVAVFAGNAIPKGAEPIAQAYAGHQFGYFTILGDGRAILLGEHITPQGERFDIQLKGSGPTPYSRHGDGRAALGPMLREYIISEGMAGLGIKTSRSLAVIETGEPVYREDVLSGAVLTRVASSHLRVGTFEYAAAKGSMDDLRALADYAIERHYPHLNEGLLEDRERYLAFFREVVKAQAELIAKWQLTGFIHGVMNTDNVSISGETIDYGPCAFMDAYDPQTVFSSIDTYGRYAYGNQPKIGAWNLARLAEALLPLFHNDLDEAVKIAEDTLEGFYDLYHSHWLTGMRAKLGLLNKTENDEALIQELLTLMKKHKADYTNTFRALTLRRLEGMEIFEKEDFSLWYEKWQRRLSEQEGDENAPYELMKKANPSVIPRNHRVEEALSAAVEHGDYQVMEKLLRVIKDPYAYSSEQEEYAVVPKGDRCYKTFCGT